MNQAKTFLVSLISEHLLAKFFAILFAAATVYLIEREITTEVNYLEQRVALVLGSAANLDKSVASSGYIIVLPEPGVFVEAPPADLRISVRGPKNRRADFLANPVLRLRVRQEQVRDVDGTKLRAIQIEDDDFEADLNDLVVHLIDPLELHLDRIDTRVDVPARVVTPTNLPANRVFDQERSVLQPASVTLRGPRSVISKFNENQSVTLTLDAAGKQGLLQSGKAYTLVLFDDIAKRSVSLVGESPPTLTVAMKEPTFEKIRLGEVAIHWSLSEEVLQALLASELVIKRDNSFTREVEIVLEGPLELMRAYAGQEAREKLAKQVYVIVDPSKEIAGIGDGANFTTVSLQALGVPPGMKANLEPPSIAFTLKRKDADNK